jgi:hypothetical protein
MTPCEVFILALSLSVMLGACLILNSLGLLLQRSKGITRRIDALQQVRPQETLKPAKTLILHRVNTLMHNEGTLSPTISMNEDAIPNRKPCGKR